MPSCAPNQSNVLKQFPPSVLYTSSQISGCRLLSCNLDEETDSMQQWHVQSKTAWLYETLLATGSGYAVLIVCEMGLCTKTREVFHHNSMQCIFLQKSLATLDQVISWCFPYFAAKRRDMDLSQCQEILPPALDTDGTHEGRSSAYNPLQGIHILSTAVKAWLRIGLNCLQRTARMMLYI